MVVQSLIDAATQLGIFSVAGYIFYKIANNFIQSEFDKKVEEHKADLEQQNLEFQNKLEQDAQKFQHELDKEQIRFSELQEKRAEVIAEMYRLAVAFSEDLRQAIHPMKQPSDKDREDLIIDARKSGREFREFFQRHRIYLPKETANDVEEFLKEGTDIHNKFEIYDIMGTQKDRYLPEEREGKLEQWLDEWERLNNDKLPELKQDLEEEFRDILGVRVSDSDE